VGGSEVDTHIYMGEVGKPEQECLFPKRSIQENQTSMSNYSVSDGHKHPFSSWDRFDFLDNIITVSDKTLRKD
jgi:hypothetical protein